MLNITTLGPCESKLQWDTTSHWWGWPSSKQKHLRKQTKLWKPVWPFPENKIASCVRWVTLIIPALWEAEAGRSLEVRSSRPAWPTWQNPVSTKNTKMSQVWWCCTYNPSYSEAEAGELLEPGRQKLQWAEIMPLHWSLGNRVRLHFKHHHRHHHHHHKFLTLISLFKPFGIRSGFKMSYKLPNSVFRTSYSTNTFLG